MIPHQIHLYSTYSTCLHAHVRIRKWIYKGCWTWLNWHWLSCPRLSRNCCWSCWSGASFCIASWRWCSCASWPIFWIRGCRSARRCRHRCRFWRGIRRTRWSFCQFRWSFQWHFWIYLHLHCYCCMALCYCWRHCDLSMGVGELALAYWYLRLTVGLMVAAKP